jgi:hypothetical protein
MAEHFFVIRFSDGLWHKGNGVPTDALANAKRYHSREEVDHERLNLEDGTKVYMDPCDCGCLTPVASDIMSMLHFLHARFQDAGVSEAVADGYARDIGFILESERRRVLNLPRNRMRTC